MRVLLDTGFLFALKVKNDKFHQRATEISLEIEWDNNESYTSGLVVNQTYSLMNLRTKCNWFFL